MTESDSEIDGYVSSDGESDFDEAVTGRKDATPAPVASTSSAGVARARSAAAQEESDSDDESARQSDSSTDEVSVQSCVRYI